MQTYVVELESEISKGFRCVKAANSLDIDVEKKSKHRLEIKADVESDFSIGLIVGASGSGKTTLTKHIFGEDCFKSHINLSMPVIEQFPKNMSYDDCQKALSGVGLTSVPCWIRPAYTLSNGQKTRAEMALACCGDDDIILIDEFTSVVDRTVAKVMAHSIQKFAKKYNKKIILCACHYDIIEWLNPDWIIDCNKQKFTDRRLLPIEQRERKEKLNFEIKKCDKSSWKYFSKYHYLSDKLPGGKLYHYGLYDGENQIGYMNFANYVPIRKNTVPIFHFNRIVIHPDYVGLRIGIQFLNECCKHFGYETKFKIMGKFSSIPTYKSLLNNEKWALNKIERKMKINKIGGTMHRGKKMGDNSASFRKKVKTYSFKYIG